MLVGPEGRAVGGGKAVDASAEVVAAPCDEVGEAAAAEVGAAEGRFRAWAYQKMHTVRNIFVQSHSCAGYNAACGKM